MTNPNEPKRFLTDEEIRRLVPEPEVSGETRYQRQVWLTRQELAMIELLRSHYGARTFKQTMIQLVGDAIVESFQDMQREQLERVQRMERQRG